MITRKEFPIDVVAALIATVLSVAVSGCKKSDQAQEKQIIIENSVVEPQQAIITGQIFIVTKGRDNIPIGDEAVYVVNLDELQGYYNNSSTNWETTLLADVSKIVDGASNYLALDRSNLDVLIAARAQWKQVEESPETSADDYTTASEWDTKIYSEILDIYTSKYPVKLTLDSMAEDASNYWEDIIYPGKSYPQGTIESATTDATGRFTIKIPESEIVQHMYLVAAADRETPDGVEKYSWLVSVDLDAQNHQDVILSNDNSFPYSNYLDLFTNQATANWMTCYSTNDAIYNAQLALTEQETSDETGQ